MEIHEGDYILGFASVGGDGVHWIATVVRRAGASSTGDWEVEARLRLSVDAVLFGSHDIKHFTSMTVPGSLAEEVVAKSITGLASLTRAAFELTEKARWTWVRSTDAQVFLKALEEEPDTRMGRLRVTLPEVSDG